MAVLTREEVFALLARHGIEGELAAIMAAGALAESGWDPQRRGDAGHSVGLFQLHDQGLGAGLSAAQREDPNLQVQVIAPEYRRWYAHWRAAGYRDAELAWRVCAWAERPRDYADPNSVAARAYRAAWAAVQAAEPAAVAALPPPPARLWAECERRRGIPYRLDPPPDGVATLDCSLFVRQVLAAVGVPLGEARTAEQLRQAIPHVVANRQGAGDWAAVRDGDLLFFTTYQPAEPPGPDGVAVGHVGIRCGRLRMWDCHAADGHAGPPGVGLTDISTPGWQAALYEARRPAYPPAPPPEPAAPCEALWAAEQSFSSALMHDVIGRARQLLDEALAAQRWDLVTSARDWLARHEV
jgi:cell wall-associated NlpC family hydrolase